MKNDIFVLGAPRSGFTLLISIINELSSYSKVQNISSRAIEDNLINIASIYIKENFFRFFNEHIDIKDYMYNGEFEVLVGGPKWINPDNLNECIIRKYIGVKDNGDFTFLFYLPKNTLNFDKVVHSHYYPQSWVNDKDFDKYIKLTSIRNPIGVINSAVFSINAITSEYIDKYISDFDEDEFRERMALYKLTDLDLFEGLVKFLKNYLDEFIPVIDKYHGIKWEDMITYPIQTIIRIAHLLDVSINEDDARKIWEKLDHKNLPKHHLYNFRKGYGIVGEWKNRLTNHHLKIFEKYDFDKYLKMLGYESIQYFDENSYNDFQKTIDSHIKDNKICNKITDDNLFKFCWNKSNIAVTSHSFDRFVRDGYSQVERSSMNDKQLVIDFNKFAKSKIELVYEVLDMYNKTKDIQSIKDKYLNELIQDLSEQGIKNINKIFDRIINLK